MREISVSIVADRAAARRSLDALISGTSGMRVQSTHSEMAEALAALERNPCDILLLRQSNASRQEESVRAVGSRIPALRVLALAPDPAEEAMLDLIRCGADGCLAAEHTSPARLLESIVELHRGGAPLTPKLAAALVRSLQRSQASPPDPPRVSSREKELLRLLADGHSYKTAAAELGVSIDTVRFHLRNLYGKLQVHSKLEAVLRAARDGLI